VPWTRNQKIAAGAGVVGAGGLLAWWLLGQTQAQGCPTGDVAELANGTCPSGYETDPNAPGCCMPIPPPPCSATTIGPGCGPGQVCLYGCIPKGAIDAVWPLTAEPPAYSTFAVPASAPANALPSALPRFNTRGGANYSSTGWSGLFVAGPPNVNNSPVVALNLEDYQIDNANGQGSPWSLPWENYVDATHTEWPGIMWTEGILKISTVPAGFGDTVTLWLTYADGSTSPQIGRGYYAH
jgi:hypothetical protein